MIVLFFSHFVQLCHIFWDFFSSFLLLGWKRAKRLTFSSLLAYVIMASCVPLQSIIIYHVSNYYQNCASFWFFRISNPNLLTTILIIFR